MEHIAVPVAWHLEYIHVYFAIYMAYYCKYLTHVYVYYVDRYYSGTGSKMLLKYGHTYMCTHARVHMMYQGGI